MDLYNFFSKAQNRKRYKNVVQKLKHKELDLLIGAFGVVESCAIESMHNREFTVAIENGFDISKIAIKDIFKEMSSGIDVNQMKYIKVKMNFFKAQKITVVSPWLWMQNMKEIKIKRNNMNRKTIKENGKVVTWLGVAEFLIYGVHHVERNAETEKFMSRLKAKIDGVRHEGEKSGAKFAENDLKFSCISFMIVDTALTNRSFDESEAMFVELLRLATNRYGSPTVACLDAFVSETLGIMTAKEWNEWVVLNEFLCSSPFAKAGKDSEGVTHILEGMTPGAVQHKTKQLEDLDFEKILIEIKNNLIEIEKEGDETIITKGGLKL